MSLIDPDPGYDAGWEAGAHSQDSWWESVVYTNLSIWKSGRIDAEEFAERITDLLPRHDRATLRGDNGDIRASRRK